MTAPELLALAYGMTCAGDHRCFYCGSSCGPEVRAAAHVKDTFAAHSAVYAGRTARPAVDLCVCPGCIIAMRSDTPRHDYPKPQRWWTFSHIVTAVADEWLTKADLPRLRNACLHPPASPCAIVLADSGQKHQLYAAPLYRGGDAIAVSLECETIAYRRHELASRLDLCARIAVAAGKPSLAEPPGIGIGIAISRHWADWETLLDQWAAAHGAPLTRLAAWLTPGKETLGKDARYASDLAIPAAPAPDAHVRRAKVSSAARRPDGPFRPAGEPGLFG